jgi:hypothetical protein
MTPPISIYGRVQPNAISLENVEAIYGSASMFFQLEMLFLSTTVARVNSKSNENFIQIFFMQKQSIKQPQNMVEEWNLIIKMNSYC